MKLSNLHLSRFRGFQQLDLEFCDDVTVIAGVNGSGKSGILKAIAGISSYLIHEITPARKKLVPFVEGDIHQSKSTFVITAQFASQGRELSAQIVRRKISPQDKTKIQKTIEDLNGRALNTPVSTTESRDMIMEHVASLEEYLARDQDVFSFQSNWAIFSKESEPLPKFLIVFYPSKRLFKEDLPQKLSGAKAASTADAYANALSRAEVSLTDFANWFRVVKKGLIGQNGFQMTLLEMLNQVITTLLPGFTELELKQTPKPHFAVLKEKEQFTLDQLSDGERSLLALAFDLTRRLTLANPETSNPINDGAAVILIDEIELHLHPTWQRQVLRRLTTAFPNCQFIVTTHSPQVIGQVAPKCLRLLKHNKEGEVEVICPTQSLGMDSSWVLQNIMGCSARDYDSERRLAAVFDAIDDERFTEAETLISDLTQEIGDFPELVEARLFLERLKMLEEINEEN